MKIVVMCPYCAEEAKLVTGKGIYPNRPDLRRLYFYQCAPCKAYVGTHKDTLTPLGRLANDSLRRAKVKAHRAFDPIWRGSNPQMTRSQAYKWLAEQLKIDLRDCHIGMFDNVQCYQAITLIRLRQEKVNAHTAE